MKRTLRLLYIRIILSPGYLTCKRLIAEVWRRLAFKRHVVHVFLQLDDPYSYLLSHYLKVFAEKYKVELRVYLSQALSGEFMPEPGMLAEYAARDSRMLASELEIPFLDHGDTPAVEHRRALLDFLAEEQDDDDFTETMHAALGVFWRGDIEGAARLVAHSRPEPAETNILIAKNQLLLRKLGHYSSAMMYYSGEWYWGVDRLLYLCARLDTLGARRDTESAPELQSLSQAMQLNLPAAVPACSRNLPPMDMYHSFRSPYSYIALTRMFDIADAFGIALDIKPVLPMVMRGVSVPRKKLLYIVKDANREARRLGVPFGRVCDPLGEGAKRCIAVFYYAKSQGKEREFVLSAGRGIWSESIDVATDEGMRVVTERCGLFWPDVVNALADNGWRAAVESNRDDLTELGLWGVPNIIVGNAAFWGQDRDWLIARQIEDLCDVGDGILV
jgi:2-hydroxychromene-2-carboxylate isomerase